MPDMQIIDDSQDLPTNIPQTSHNGIAIPIIRGNLNTDWVELLDSIPSKGGRFVCDTHNIDTSSILDHAFQWNQVGDFSEEWDNINPDELPKNSDPYYINSNLRRTGNVENMNTLDEVLNYFSNNGNSSDYVLIVDTNVFNGEEFATFPFPLMSEYASYETTPVICFIINGKPCYAVRPGKIKTMSATTPILESKGAAQIRIVDVTQIETLISEMYVTPVIKPEPQPSTGDDLIISTD